MRRVLITGAGGFIGGAMLWHLWTHSRYSEFVATDLKPLCKWWHQPAHLPGVEATTQEDLGRSGLTPRRTTVLGKNSKGPVRLTVCPEVDLRDRHAAVSVVEGADDILHFAAWMGGIPFIETNVLECLLRNSQINNSVVSALLSTNGHDRAQGSRVFWAGSACAYPVNQQSDATVTGLPEHLAWQGQPEKGYGEEKLFSESLFEYLREDRGIETHVARFHNVYGTHTEWCGGREKAPAAICRKVATAKLTGDHSVTIWGDGTRTRSFMYIDDCVEGILRIMNSDVYGPINLGSEEQVSIHELVELVADIAGITVNIQCDMTQPQGVVGRNSDNTMIREKLGWEPSIPLRQGLEQLYPWVEQKVKEAME